MFCVWGVIEREIESNRESNRERERERERENGREKKVLEYEHKGSMLRNVFVAIAFY